MYSHTAVCDECGREFMIETRAGEPVNRGGICKECQRRRGLKQMFLIGAGVAAFFVVFIASAAICG